MIQSYSVLLVCLIKSSFGEMDSCCSKIRVSGENVHLNFQGTFIRSKGAINGQGLLLQYIFLLSFPIVYYVMENEDKERITLWTNHLKHWIIGYERETVNKTMSHRL